MGRAYAHSATSIHPEGHALSDHLRNTAMLAKKFAAPFGLSREAFAAGLMHDIGKKSQQFQDRLTGSQKKVPHAFAGAKEAYDFGDKRTARIVVAHHTGLLNDGTALSMDSTLLGILNKEYEKEFDYSGWEKEFPKGITKDFILSANDEKGLAEYFKTKMLYSCLTDADWIDTQNYFEGIPEPPREIDYDDLSRRLHEKIDPWLNSNATGINEKRNRILRHVISLAAKEPGWFTMTVPTGGGKTWASMAFAVEHAKAYRKRRIIYVVPFCSILGQTKDDFFEVFQKEDFFLHYTGGDFSGEKDAWKRAESWDFPIIMTTEVQFFNSMYSASKGSNRKLHNIADSVIIFDEAQKMPAQYIIPCLSCIDELVTDYGCTAVLCTATQPAAMAILGQQKPTLKMTELCPERDKTYEEFRRVKFQFDGKKSMKKLAKEISKKNSVLCVVNTRAEARKLYSLIKNRKNGVFHMSTWMLPTHRKVIEDEIRARLADPSNPRCILIATSLVEAGIDFDFGEAYRELAGLEAIIQAGGRCNRHGKRKPEDSIVHVVDIEDGNGGRMFATEIGALKTVLKTDMEIDSPKAIEMYYRLLWHRISDAQKDKKNIIADAEKLRFRTVSDNFHMIENDDCTVYLPWKEGRLLVKRFLAGDRDKVLMRELAKYAVGVKQDQYQRMLAAGVILGDEVDESSSDDPAKRIHSGVLDQKYLRRYYSVVTGFLSR